MILILTGVFALVVLIGAGTLYRGRGSWVILSLTLIGIPLAFISAILATGIGHPSGELHLAKAALPYMVLPFTLRLIPTENMAGVVCLGMPLLQVLTYGVVLASGWSRGRFWPRAGWLLAIHLIASAAAFAFHKGGYLQPQ